MNTLLKLSLPLLLALSACTDRADSVVEREGRAPVSMIEDEDSEMNAAMAKARRTLDEFEQHLANPKPTQSMVILKGLFTEGDNAEHMWINGIQVTSEGYRGVLGNEPLDLPSYSAGQVVELARENVSDWVVVDDGKLSGGYTLLVIRSRLPADERAAFDAQNGVHIED